MTTIISTAVGFVYGAYWLTLLAKNMASTRAAARLTENLGTLSNIIKI